MNVTTPSSEEKNQKINIDWNHSIEELLCAEAEKCFGLSWMHSHAEKMFRNKNNWIQIPMIILSTLSGSIQVVAQTFDPRISQSLSIISFSVSLLGMINSHFRYAQRAESHKVASVQYSHVHRLISIEMSLSRKQRTPPKYLLKMIKEDLKGFMENFPRIPDKIIQEYKEKMMNTENKSQSKFSHPDIVSPVKEVIPYEKTILNNNSTIEPIEEEENGNETNSNNDSAFNTPVSETHSVENVVAPDIIV